MMVLAGGRRGGEADVPERLAIRGAKARVPDESLDGNGLKMESERGMGMGEGPERGKLLVTTVRGESPQEGPTCPHRPALVAKSADLPSGHFRDTPLAQIGRYIQRGASKDIVMSRNTRGGRGASKGRGAAWRHCPTAVS